MQKTGTGYGKYKEGGEQLPDILTLFLTFAKISLFTFGGGYAMISLIEETCVEQKKWITHEEMMDVTVIAESTPGPIAINFATYAGYRKGGILGAVAATLGMVLPSFVIIYIIALFLDGFLTIKWIVSAFTGIRLAVGILIIDAAVKMIVRMEKKPLPFFILICSFAAMLLINILSFRFSSLSLMLIAGALGLIVFVIQGAPEEDTAPEEETVPGEGGEK